MKLYIRLFAGLADSIGSQGYELTVEQESITAGELKTLLSTRFPDAAGQIGQAFAAVNQEYAPDETIITSADEVALIPPVSGGQPEEEEDAPQQTNAETEDKNDTLTACTEDGLFSITPLPLDAEAVTAKVIHPNHGASLVFIGTTREMTGERKTVYLDYEAYTPMALKKLQEIGTAISEQWPGTITAITHRIGKVDIAEASVIIAVSSPHREVCYEASRFAIETLKQIVPIWKKEIWDDGSEWKGSQSGSWNPFSK